MVAREEFDEIVLREKEKSFFISRIPKQVKEEIIDLANKDFCGDYGMVIKYIWDNYKLWMHFMGHWDLKLDNIYNLLLNLDLEKNPDESKVKMLDGKKVKGGSNKNGST